MSEKSLSDPQIEGKCAQCGRIFRPTGRWDGAGEFCDKVCRGLFRARARYRRYYAKHRDEIQRKRCHKD